MENDIKVVPYDKWLYASPFRTIGYSLKRLKVRPFSAQMVLLSSDVR